MFLKYNGLTENFKYFDVDFSKGPVEVPDSLGKLWIEKSPRTFTQVIPASVAKPTLDELKAKAKAKADAVFAAKESAEAKAAKVAAKEEAEEEAEAKAAAKVAAKSKAKVNEK